MVSPIPPDIAITALSDPVAIVHIPIHLSDQCSTRLYWTVDNAPGLSNEFFNVTSNTIEIAIFGRTDLISSYWTDLGDNLSAIKISSTWRVFEISSGDQGETNNYDSPHLRHVSAPLSKAGISILYQSSYFTDFLLVKESNFAKASEIFTSHGWHVDPNVPSPRRRSQVLTPSTSTPLSHPSSVHPPPTPELTVLPSPLACVGFSHSIERATAERVRQLVVWPEQARKSWQQKRQSSGYSLSPPRSANSDGNNSRLSDGGDGRAETSEKPFLSYTRTEDGASIVTETRILRWMFGRQAERSLNRDDGIVGYESALEGTEFQLGGQLSMGYVTETTDIEATSDDGGDDDDDDNDNEYDGHGNDNEEEMEEGGEISPLARSVFMEGKSSKRVNSQLSLGLHTPPLDEDRRSKHLSLPTSPRDSPNSYNIPISWTKTGRRSTISLRLEHTPPVSTRADTEGEDEGENEGNGYGGREGRRGRWRDRDRDRSPRTKSKVGRKRCLQLDLRGLGDNDDLQSHLSLSPLFPGHTPAHIREGEEAGREGAGEGGASRRGSEVYHLDKSGLVTLFSDMLNRDSIRMLYSSTFNTANILVKARDVHRAKRLLEGKTGSPIKSVFL